MQHWQPYIRASWELVMEAQGQSQTYLEPDVEAFLVHSMARSFDKANIWDQPIAVKMLMGQQMPNSQKQPFLREVGEECLFIDAWEIRQPRWPSPGYFCDMGAIAFGMASMASRPADELLDLASTHFQLMSRVLRQVRDLYLHK
jgi:hypothetical protein